ncbi:MAG: DUF6392 family protein [Pseudomonas sp.]
MSEFKLGNWIESLGRTYAALVSDKIIQPSDFMVAFPGDDSVHLEPEEGVDFSFWAETEVLEAIIFTLKKTSPHQVELEGELPAPYAELNNKVKAHEYFGSPLNSRGPMKLPSPLGNVGGWDQFDLGPHGYPNVYVMFKYTVEFDVMGVVFALIDKGHE